MDLPLHYGSGTRGEMIYRVFGRTGLRLPVYSLGGMRFMQSWDHEAGITPTSDGNVHTIIHHALSVGINHIDTARGYGTSERQIGRVLKDMPRDKYLISTKVTPKSDSAKSWAAWSSRRG